MLAVKGTRVSDRNSTPQAAQDQPPSAVESAGLNDQVARLVAKHLEGLTESKLRRFRAGQRLVAAFALLIVGVVVAVTAYSLGQSSAKSPRIDANSASVALQELQQQVSVLRDRLNTTTGLLDFLLAALTALLALGGLTSFVGWFRNEARQQTLHDQFLAPSRATLELVNGTLELARDASSRSADAILHKARSTLEALDAEARHLIERTPPQDDHDLVADQTKRSELISLANRISGFEVNQFILPDEIPLTPACKFIMGLSLHVDQQFVDAMKHWDGVTISDRADAELRSRANYWIGYELRNMGNFAEAEGAFDRAQKGIGPSARLIELQRIHLETRFFNQREEQVTALIPLGEGLLGELTPQLIDEAAEAERIRLMATLGNMNHQAGREALGRKKSAQARQYFREAQRIFRVADRDHYPWADFGLAESTFALGQVDAALKLFSTTVLKSAQEEYFSRVEPRARCQWPSCGPRFWPSKSPHPSR
jgi:tetratricopeptide (TPR) repeat protein